MSGTTTGNKRRHVRKPNACIRVRFEHMSCLIARNMELREQVESLNAQREAERAHDARVKSAYRQPPALTFAQLAAAILGALLAGTLVWGAK